MYASQHKPIEVYTYKVRVSNPYPAKVFAPYRGRFPPNAIGAWLATRIDGCPLKHWVSGSNDQTKADLKRRH